MRNRPGSLLLLYKNWTLLSLYFVWGFLVEKPCTISCWTEGPIKFGMLYSHKALLSWQLGLFLDIAFAFPIQFYMAHSYSHVIDRETNEAEGAAGSSLWSVANSFTPLDRHGFCGPSSEWLASWVAKNPLCPAPEGSSPLVEKNEKKASECGELGRDTADLILLLTKAQHPGNFYMSVWDYDS